MISDKEILDSIWGMPVGKRKQAVSLVFSLFDGHDLNDFWEAVVRKEYRNAARELVSLGASVEPFDSCGILADMIWEG